MEENGIITGYSSLIDIFKLGYHVYRLYLKLQNIPPLKKKELINSNLLQRKNERRINSPTRGTQANLG